VRHIARPELLLEFVFVSARHATDSSVQFNELTVHFFCTRELGKSFEVAAEARNRPEAALEARDAVRGEASS
jgi:hypothetical protein